MRRTIEICLSDIESVRHAIRGGATSVEICSDRPEGGTTPSIGLVEEAVKLCSKHNVEVHVLIRPRAGDFVYSKEEFEVMKRDILAAKVAGADGKSVILMKK
jgi:copper homeostasis protein